MEGQNARYMKKKSSYLVDTLIQFGVLRTNVDQGTGHVTIAKVFTHTEIANFDLAPNDDMTVQSLADNSLKAAKLNRFEARVKPGQTKGKKSGFFSKKIQAYYLPFKTGEGHTMQLGTGAKFFFTPTLNGCTFACGTGAQNPRVSHINLQFQNSQIDQPRMDAMVNRLHVATQFVVRRADYKPNLIGPTEDYQAIIVGFREVTRWEFYLQKFKIDFTNPPHVHTIISNTKLN